MTTHIGIDLRRRLGTVDRRIFSQFIEHLGRCIYGGIYEEDRTRIEMLEARYAQRIENAGGMLE